ncbi:leucine-rich repeat domain-containing protein [Stigmatella sp. ncwal1]|uniref:Leucine-rich repeat domain-containing protein n=1 Tax=Stigmatella ashevillensis TaxID=2995309 RepID=A0ABT5DDS7_9BACT|nr:leucine-rich repeat domain-containing protein [Stigmatella ashevillena]MDC0711754.1 leucine-rich repeat domain-containing protein [Stigmatella ashevillena]
MSLMTSLILPIVGPPVAKLLLKKYLSGLGDAQVLGLNAAQAGEGVGEQLVDIAAEKLSDMVDRRQAVRVFEEIADKIILQLAPLFEEAQKRGHLNLEAVAHELASALSGRISADFLIARELDPAKLSRAFREAHPLPRAQLSEAETALYERALDQSARYLVSVASQLPHFETKWAATQLQKIARMQDDLSRTLESVRSIEEQVLASSPNRTYATFEANYRQAVTQAVDELELFGVDIEPQSKKYRLSVAYISLNLLSESTGDEDPTLVSTEHLLQQLRPGDGRLLIRGMAGSGKSTLFRWAALTAATGGRQGNPQWGPSPISIEAATTAAATFSRVMSSRPLPLHTELYFPSKQIEFPLTGILRMMVHGNTPEEAWFRRIPILIRLRDCKNGKLPPIEEFTTQLAWALGSPPSGWMKSILESGRALVLLDGVDEVPDRDRAEIHKAVEQLIHQYPDCYYLLSTRPAAIERGGLKPLGFQEADINPLSELDRDQLIGRWHEAVAKVFESRGLPTTGLGEQSEKLKRELRENPPIALLATNPLLAAMICALHRERSQRLPESQAELCEALCNMLLHRRERESHLRLEEFPEAYRALSYFQKRAIVAELAVHMVRNETSVLERAEALFKVGDVLEKIPGRQRDENRTVLDGLIQRSGMLREARPGAVDFIHNTFKEYLAGDLLAQQRNDGLMGKKALEPAWQNILVFAAARGESSFVQNLVIQVLGETSPGERPKGKKGGKSRLSPEQRTRALMAIRLRSAVQFLDKVLEARINSLQSALFPPSTMADAEALATAGDAVVPYLRYQPALSTRSIAACVRALRLINSPTAKACLKDYLVETRAPVLWELAQAVNPLEINCILEMLLRGNPLPVEIRRHVSDLSPLASLQGLRSLNLSGSQVSDLSPLASLQGLQSLNLSGSQVSDLSPLASLQGLRSLNLSGSQVSDLSPLASLQGLQSLNLSGSQVSDLSLLATLQGLQSLNLSGSQASVLPLLAALKNLQSLNLSDAQVSDLPPLTEFQGLQSLTLSDAQISDLSPLTELQGLQSLTLSGSQISDFSPLTQLQGLQSLNLSGSQISDLSPLAVLQGLQSLFLSSSQISDLSPLAALQGLQSLFLSGSQISDLSPLAALQGLQSLFLSGSQISDLSPLAALQGLQSLYLLGVQVSDFSPLEGLKDTRITR